MGGERVEVTTGNPHAEGLARLIRDLGERGARGWKQDLASKLGVSPGYVSKFLRPPYPNLSERTAAQIEQRLGLDEGALAQGGRAKVRTTERTTSELTHADTSATPRDPSSAWRRAVERVRAELAHGVQPSAAPPSVYDLVRRMDARELRAFRAWVLAWTDEGPDAS